MTAKTMYLDAAGDPGWPPPFGRSRVEWYVLAGLVLSPEADMELSNKVSDLLAEYIPKEERAKWPDRNYEIHYHDIIFGKNIFSHLENEKRKELSDKIFDIITSAKPLIFATAINKTQMKRVYHSRAYPPRSLAVRSTIHRFSMYLNREEHIGSVVVDEEEYKKDKEVRQLVHDLKRYGAEIQGRHYQAMKVDNLERILNPINMSPEMSTGIQLVDVCSRSIWSHFEKGKSNRFHQLEPFFDRDESRVYEPSIVPAPSRWV